MAIVQPSRSCLTLFPTGCSTRATSSYMEEVADMRAQLMYAEQYITKEALMDSGAAFARAVLAIHVIIARKLYKSAFLSLEEYFTTRHSLSRAHVYRLLDCAEVIIDLQTPLDARFVLQPLPTKQRVCRTLKLLAPSAYLRQLLWSSTLAANRAAVKQQANRNFHLPLDITSKHINTAWEKLLQVPHVQAELQRLQSEPQAMEPVTLAPVQPPAVALAPQQPATINTKKRKLEDDTNASTGSSSCLHLMNTAIALLQEINRNGYTLHAPNDNEWRFVRRPSPSTIKQAHGQAPEQQQQQPMPLFQPVITAPLSHNHQQQRAALPSTSYLDTRPQPLPPPQQQHVRQASVALYPYTIPSPPATPHNPVFAPSQTVYPCYTPAAPPPPQQIPGFSYRYSSSSSSSSSEAPPTFADHGGEQALSPSRNHQRYVSWPSANGGAQPSVPQPTIPSATASIHLPPVQSPFAATALAVAGHYILR
ncbi:hypothetical protein RI367_005077 [Sorochytrium milnesiophthora]